ncbi:glyceraldehyde-3-phosphate dehydrogenase [Paenibacillus darwinianus]|uniref:Glyceraldehyde-3-phosphate dehydrogenase n=1 Tax=Paenibacillus darwinianus TaxID=1380763 RepID=A0A9W5W7I9_9BACL|nr:type I glyceraldehyde-3-phosphate dehydrogenase [Paenibacillus darwinianus]EXX89724.1 glyceraldehyde-3-phosphate dehydrogenase [Paenibacillus darwinianus]EXX89877.1 glyceraldehyde-3-phosphate dehydrogenase [Paenibacillus darwinianus]EXX90133.1 glyceraldehyde-3-phosphate dehydrogenase [Paenibacillus darwinianus]
MRVAVNGTGRIGRMVLRQLLSDDSEILELAAVNSTVSADQLAHLLKYDSVHRTWDRDVESDGEAIIVNGRRIPLLSQRAIERLNWSRYGVELVIEATGKFNNRAEASGHLRSGAERVLLTAPGKDVDLTVVMGVNDDQYDPARHRLLSAASCTTNCLAPVLHILDHAFGVKSGWMTTVHAYTSDQNHLDNPHKDLRRARACTGSIIPTSTGVGKAIAEVLPHLASRIQGISIRVPTQNVSLLDLQAEVGRPVEAGEVKDAFRQACAGPLGRYVGYNELPLVSSDYIGNDKSSIIDGLSVMVRNDQVKLLAWYDNEWAYAGRVVDFAAHIANIEMATIGGIRA